jgi:tRNA (mo5U34)-methyltransferase
LTSICLRRIVEDLGFEVRRLTVRHDRVLLEARRRPAESQNTRLWLAYAKMPSIPVTGDKNDPEAWTLF